MAAARAKRKVLKQDQTHILTTGTTIRFEKPRSSRTAKSKTEQAVVVIHEANPVSGFVNFLRENAIIGLAVGFAVATQVQAIVKQLISSFVDPMYALVFGGQTLSAETFVITWNGRAQEFLWGAFIYTIINFLFVLAIIYGLIKFFKLENWDKKKKEADKK